MAHYAACLGTVQPAGRPLCKGFNLDFTPGSISAGLTLTTLLNVYYSALLNIPWVPSSFFGPATQKDLDSSSHDAIWLLQCSLRIMVGIFLELLLHYLAIRVRVNTKVL